MNTLCFNSFPSITTNRTILRQLVIEDGTEIFKLRSDDRVNEFLGRPFTVSYQEAQLFIQERNKGIKNNECLYWGIVLKNNPAKIIGTICLWNFSNDHYIAEIGYELSPNFQGIGIMQEAILSVIEFGFRNLKLETITAVSHVQNAKSIKLLEKCNFTSHHKSEHKWLKEQELTNMVIYILNNKKNYRKN